MDQQKKALSREIDAIIVGCALGEARDEARDEACDEAGLVRLAIQYATEFRCPYQLSAAHMRSLETDAEREVARQLEIKVNGVIKYTIRRTTPAMMGLGLLAMQRFTAQPKPAKKLMRACKCTATKRSPNCKMPITMCKHTNPSLVQTIKRKPRTKSASPRTKSASPKTKSASPRTKSASPRTKSASPRTKSASPRQ